MMTFRDQPPHSEGWYWWRASADAKLSFPVFVKKIYEPYDPNTDLQYSWCEAEVFHGRGPMDVKEIGGQWRACY